MRLSQIDFPLDELKEFGQTSFNIESMLVMTMFIFALMGLVFAVFKLKTSGQPKSGDLTPALQTLGGVIANEMRSVVEDAKEDRAMFMKSFAAQSREHTGMMEAIAGQTKILREFMQLLTGHTGKVDDNQTAITQLSADQQESNKQVADMNGDITEIKATVLGLSKEIEDMRKDVLLILEKLEEETTAETEKVEDIPLKPPPPGVPVTPKPVETQSANLYKENPKEESK